MSSTSVRRNPNFYLEDLFFLVEGNYFKVYAFYFLEHSEKIRTLFGNKSFEGYVNIGMNRLRPIVLENIRAIDFEQFLELVYPIYFSYSATIMPKARTIDSWLSIMKVATELGIQDLQKLCISSIKPLVADLAPINKFQLAHHLVDGELLIDALCKLVSNVNSLTPSEAEILGFETTYRIMQMREIWCQTYRKTEQNQYLRDKRNSQTSDALRLCRTVRWGFRAQLKALGLTVEEDEKTCPDFLEGYPTDHPDVLFPNENGEVRMGKIGIGYVARFPPLSNLYAFFYRDSRSIVFQIEGELFKAHFAYFQDHSPVFRDMLRVNPSSPEGTTEKRPLCIHGIKARDFEVFLSLLTSNPELKTVTLDYNEWRSVLELSTLWRMQSLRKLCMTQMSPFPAHITPLEKASMARKYMVGDWLVDAFNELICRDEALTDEEANQLSPTTAFKLLRVQVEWLKEPNGNQPLKKAIRDAFQTELQTLYEYDLDSKLNPFHLDCGLTLT